VSKKILIVESENDKYFIEVLIQYLALTTVEVDTPICNIHDYECLDGLGNFDKRLTNLKKEIASKGIEKIDILIDADDKGVNERIKFIDTHLKQICLDVNVTQMNEIHHSDELDVDFVCCITHVNGKGELETLLKTIKSEDSTYADCLDAWRECLKTNNKEISDKDFDKFWVNNYLRYDTCTKKEQTQADRKCKNEIAIKKPIWNFEHEALSDLKAFLQLF
jgi:hypothetical protein